MKRHWNKLILLFLSLYCIHHSTKAQQIVVEPYLQDATDSTINIMWETSTGASSKVLWGTTKELDNTTDRVFSMVNKRPSEIHRVKLEGLTPLTRYYYKVVTGNVESSIYHFTTPPRSTDDHAFQILAMSDMQRDNKYPKKFQEIIDEGALPYLMEKNGDDLFANLAMVVIPGDLTVDGLVYTDWTQDFFGQSKKLLPYVPVYPVLGNHENNSDYYFNYFHLPDNGSAGYMEHWYYKDYGNVRIVGLNSNDNYRIQEQLDWLDDVLSDAADKEHIDFVFAQLHHPHKSELWIPGERDYTGDVIFRLEQFSTRTGKPTIHFYGHTHGYARGQSLDHAHLWVNVATAGGKIDGWGEYEQTNYDEFPISSSDYGFVIVEVEGGDDPKFKLARISRGDVANPKDNEVTDIVEVKRYNEAPQTPQCLSPISEQKVQGSEVLLKASAFVSGDGSEHGEVQWQVGRTYNFANPDHDIWNHYQDWYMGKDLNKGIDLTSQKITDLLPNKTYYWRVRYRSKGLTWSKWSETQKFVVK